MSRRRASGARPMRGLTLIELAIALFIVTLMLGGLLGPLAARIEQNDRNQTERGLAEIREALYGFAVANGRLPCPDTNGDGRENVAAGLCAGATGDWVVGTLPFTDLGVVGLDAWDQVFRYGVSHNHADDIDGGGAAGASGACTPTPPLNVSVELCTEGVGRVEDEGGAAIIDDSPAIVISYGANWTAAPGAGTAEQENQDADRIAVDTIYGADGTYDDLLIWLSPAVLKNRMLQAELLP